MRARFVILALFLASCSEMFPPASAVSEFRIVGAKSELESDPARSNPSPGDALQVALLPIDRGAPVEPEPSLTPGPLEWLLVPCIPLPVTIGTPICGPTLPCEGCDSNDIEDPLALPVVRFQAPPEEVLDQLDASSLLLQGVVCSNGTPTSEDELLRFLTGETDELSPCEDEPLIEGRPVEGRFLASTILLERDPADPNLNPELQNVLLNGRSWPPPYDQGVPRDAPRRGCDADLEGLTNEQRAAHPRAGDQASSIDLSVTQGSLQTFTVDGTELVEEIQVSWLADSGGFERSFSFITDPARSVLTQWKPFNDAPADGELVRFTFVIRDGRGGTDWVERGLCVLPPPPE